MNAALVIIVVAYVFAVGWFAGRTREWSRVLDYLHQHKHERPVSRIAAGIAADEHRRRSPVPSSETETPE